MFRGKKKVVDLSVKDVKNTFIAKEIEVKGNIKGEGDAQIEGTFHGDITVTSVVIGEYGTINGTIRAKNVMVNGNLNGSVFCDRLEVMPNGNVSNDIKVKQLFISGSVDGTIESKEEIILDKTAKVNATIMKSKIILIDGIFKGKVTASELLEIGSRGSVEGEITVKHIKTHTGGKISGAMHNYVEEKPALFTNIIDV